MLEGSAESSWGSSGFQGEGLKKGSSGVWREGLKNSNYWKPHRGVVLAETLPPWEEMCGALDGISNDPAERTGKNSQKIVPKGTVNAHTFSRLIPGFRFEG